RVVVTDFGIARRNHEADANSVGTSSLYRSTEVGTPAFMAPETLRGRGSDARADQFAFCVTLFMALYGRHPFADDADSPLRSSAASQVEELPGEIDVPSWLEAVVLRGLESDPDERFASMDELIAALGDDPVARQRNIALVAIGAVGVALLAFGISHAVARSTVVCSGYESRLVGVWDENVRSRAKIAFNGAAVPYRVEAWKLAETTLDDYADSWVAMQRSSCEATVVRRVQSEQIRDLRTYCLEGRLKRLSGLARVFEQADDAVVSKATEVAASLPAIERCADVEALKSAIEPPEDPETEKKTALIRGELAFARSLGAAARTEDAIASASEAVEKARSSGYEPVAAEAHAALGEILHAAGKSKEAESALREAIWAAEASGHDAVAFTAWNTLATELGYRQRRFEDAARVARHAEAYWRRGGREPFAGAELYTQLGLSSFVGAKLDDAVENFETALRYVEQSAYEQHPLEARILNAISASYGRQGKLSRAVEFNHKAFEQSSVVLGTLHPRTLLIRANQGSLQFEFGNYEQALEIHQQLLDTYETLFGSSHREVARSGYNVAIELLALNRPAEALEMIERVVEMRRQLLGENHPDSLRAVQARVDILLKLGRLEEAANTALAVLAAQDARVGSGHPDRAYTLLSVAEIRAAQGRLR
ncbi:MAG: tetratricopeptide repeat-containing protein kinase family protein, partial [Myxococcota bacterium]